MDLQADALQRIAAAVTPAVMVSACGLIALGLDNQAARMSARLRELAREYRNLASSEGRRDSLKRQIDAFDGRHRLLARALQLNYGAMLGFVLTSFLELAKWLMPIPSGVPLLTFAAGVLMLGGLALLVIVSTSRARSAIVFEIQEVERGSPGPDEPQGLRARV